MELIPVDGGGQVQALVVRREVERRGRIQLGTVLLLMLINSGVCLARSEGSTNSGSLACSCSDLTSTVESKSEAISGGES
uniref:Uncharacterized protein n=1 Tax=Timema tahoe TaxID=61484 RepID=A0A7R9NVY8_9NEOP|nr:unnamed protein product [Timema tahoe]